MLDGLPDGRGLNIAHEAVDRHALGPRADHLALRWLGRAGERRDLSFRELAAATNRFANVLRGLGVGVGERVFILAGRVPELYVAALGALKNRSVVSPLFSAFGPGADRHPPADGAGTGARDHRGTLPPQGRADPRPASGAGACHPDRCRRPCRARCPGTN